LAEHAELEIEVLSRGESAGVRVRGELDMATTPRLRDVLAPLVSDGADVFVDCGGLSYIDASALSLFVEQTKACRARGGRFVIGNPTPLLQRILQITGLDPVLDIEGP
jgi:anti-sigma B factor antagonist